MSCLRFCKIVLDELTSTEMFIITKKIHYSYKAKFNIISNLEKKTSKRTGQLNVFPWLNPMSVLELDFILKDISNYC